MKNSSKPTEPTRPLPPPYEDNEGNLRAITSLSSKDHKTRARIPVPPAKIIPVIVVAGIMGSNLRANTSQPGKKNKELNPGEAAWRPPNGMIDGLDEAKKWKGRDPATRQRILDAETLEVDPTGAIGLPPTTVEFAWDKETAQRRGWGEIHYDSYGSLLLVLQHDLNTTFQLLWDVPILRGNWDEVKRTDRRLWGTTNTGDAAEFTDEEIKKFSDYHYPVYAFGYNWLKSNYESAQKLKDRIETIIEYWKKKKRECDKVILVTHSMGGLVARGCAKLIPEKIVGVIHGVMPALGAPVCYRRLACGTEGAKPDAGKIASIKADKFATIAGKTVLDATPVLAVSSGPLELLPTHLYPQPWLYVSTQVFRPEDQHYIINFPKENPYDLYRDTTSWYRPVLAEFADPANLTNGQIASKIKTAIERAEWFHKSFLKDYYHPFTYAFFGSDPNHQSFGNFKWISDEIRGFSDAQVMSAKLVSQNSDGSRLIKIGGKDVRLFPSWHDVDGDGTVPFNSANNAAGRVRQFFPSQGYEHQGCFNHRPVQLLTVHLIVKMVQSL